MGDTLTFLKAYVSSIKRNCKGQDLHRMAKEWIDRAPPSDAEYKRCVDYLNNPDTWK
jgi:hypothetical protein